MHFNALSKSKEKESIRAREDYVLLIFIIVGSRDLQAERAVFLWLINIKFLMIARKTVGK